MRLKPGLRSLNRGACDVQRMAKHDLAVLYIVSFKIQNWLNALKSMAYLFQNLFVDHKRQFSLEGER